MPEKGPIQRRELQDFYSNFAHIIESKDSTEAQAVVRGWNGSLFRDMRSEAEVLVLMFGQGTSDRYLFGLSSAAVAMKVENGGFLPALSDKQYEFDKEIQDSHQAAQDAAMVEYFTKLEQVFEAKFPLTALFLGVLEQNLRVRHQVPEADIQEGFIPGYYKAIKAATPLFMDEPRET